MRFITLALLSLSVLLASAQTPKAESPATSDLLAELADLPACVVSINIENQICWITADSFVRPAA